MSSIVKFFVVNSKLSMQPIWVFMSFTDDVQLYSEFAFNDPSFRKNIR